MPDESKSNNSLNRLISEYRDQREAWLNIGTPWVTEGAKAWLARNISQRDRVLEFGAGRSSIFWATQAGRVTIVEASIDWTCYVLFYLYQRPNLLKKVRFYFCPAEWNPSFPQGARRYWKENRDSLDSNDIYDLERDLSTACFPENNIVSFDGSIRHKVFIRQITKMDWEKCDVIVIDNTESVITSELASALIPEYFVRLDFVAGPLDNIPPHQKGRHITSIFVEKSRLGESIPVITHIDPKMDFATRSLHMTPFGKTFDVKKIIDQELRYFREKLGIIIEYKPR